MRKYGSSERHRGGWGWQGCVVAVVVKAGLTAVDCSTPHSSPQSLGQAVEGESAAAEGEGHRLLTYSHPALSLPPTPGC